MMKKIIILLAVAMSTVFATADDRMYVNDFTIGNKATKVVEIMLDNEKSYCAFQTDIYLPSGLEIAMDDDEYIVDPTSRMDRTHMISTNRLANGAIRVFVTSQGSQPFKGNSGAIATMTLVTKGNAPAGRLKLRGSVVVEEDGTRHQLDNTFANVNGGGSPYDVNDDGNVDVGDVNAVLADILAGGATSLYDVNGDGNVDVGDVNAILADILSE